MKGLPKFTARQKRPSNSSNAVNSPSIPKKRTKDYLPGAFLLVALIVSVSYGSANNNSHPASTVNAQVKPLSAEQKVTNNTNSEPTQATPAADKSKDTAMKNSQAESNGAVSTSITNNNGQTKVTVNGEAVVTPEDGNVSKTVTTDNGNKVEVNVTQQNSSTGNGYVNSYSSSSTHSFNFNTENTMGNSN